MEFVVSQRPVLVIILQFFIAYFGYVGSDNWKNGKAKWVFVSLAMMLGGAQLMSWNRDVNKPAPVPISKSDLSLCVVSHSDEPEHQPIIEPLGKAVFVVTSVLSMPIIWGARSFDPPCFSVAVRG